MVTYRADDERPELPLRFGPYTLVRRLGGVGIGSTYLGLRENDSALFVVKRLHHERLGDEKFKARFVDGAQVARHIRHPNVIAPVDVGRVADEPYFVMPYVFGVSASAILEAIEEGQTAPLPLGVGLSLGVGLASGLEAIHHARHRKTGAALGRLHRALGPRKVLVGFDGVLRIIGLGLGKSDVESRENAIETLASSPESTSHEQATGCTVDARSDVYAACVTLWELFAGMKRIRETDVGARLARALGARPEPLRGHRSDVPEALERLLTDGMSPDPDCRIESASAMKSRLIDVWVSSGANASPMDVAEWLTLALERARHREEAMIREAQALARSVSPIAMAKPIALASRGCSLTLEDCAAGVPGSELGQADVPTLTTMVPASLQPTREERAVGAPNVSPTPYDYYGADGRNALDPALDAFVSDPFPVDVIARIAGAVRSRTNGDASAVSRVQVLGGVGAFARLLARSGLAVRGLALVGLGALILGASWALQIKRTSEASAPPFDAGRLSASVEAPSVAPPRASTLARSSIERLASGLVAVSPELVERKSTLVERIRAARRRRIDVAFQTRLTRLSAELSRARTIRELDDIEAELTVLEGEG